MPKDCVLHEFVASGQGGFQCRQAFARVVARQGCFQSGQLLFASGLFCGCLLLLYSLLFLPEFGLVSQTCQFR